MLADLDERFAAEHERTYGHRAEDDPVEVVHIRVEGRVASGSSLATSTRTIAATVDPDQRSRARVFRTTPRPAPTHALSTAASSSAKASTGPLIVEEYDATTLVPPGLAHSSRRSATTC